MAFLANEEDARKGMDPWEGIVGRTGKMQFAAPVLGPSPPGENRAGNVAIGKVEALVGGVLTIRYAETVDHQGRRTHFRLHLPAAALVAFLEVAEEEEAPGAPVALFLP